MSWDSMGVPRALAGRWTTLASCWTKTDWMPWMRVSISGCGKCGRSQGIRRGYVKQEAPAHGGHG